MDKLFYEWVELVYKISKVIIKKMWGNILDTPSMLKNKKELILFLTVNIITFTYLLISKSHWILFILAFFIYYFLKAICQSIKDMIIAVKEELTGRKYKGISELFDKKVKVIRIEDNKVILNSFIPYQEIEKKKAILEHYFNNSIEQIKRNPNNFRHVTIYLKTKQQFKKSYPLSKYIKEAKKMGKIPFMLGMGKGNKITVMDLTAIHHFIISGGSGGGKSTLLNAIIQSLMYFNNNICYIFVDFKRVSLNIYKKFTNSIFIKTHDIFLDYLEKIYKEMNDRYDLIESAELEDIWQYNKQYNADIPIIIMVIDEIANLKESSDNKVNDRIEMLLRQILNMGRAAGIHLIVATQRPAGVQLSTEVRAGLLGKISFNVQEIETQKMTGVKNTQDLGQGEFKTSNMGLNGQVFKGFWTDRVKEWAVFEELKNMLTDGDKKEQIDIIEKQIQTNDKNIFLRLKNKLLKNNNKSVEHIPEQNKLCTSKKSVIELILKFKNIENNILCSSVPENQNDLTLQIEEFLKSNSEGGKIPTNETIEKTFSINKRKRIQIYEELAIKNILIKSAGNRWILNINN